GSDIDDAVALAYLLAHPDAEIVGVTTVSGNTEQRAACVNALREAAGADVPVHAGLSGPLLDGPGQPDVPQVRGDRDGRGTGREPGRGRVHAGHDPCPARRDRAAHHRATDER